MPLTTSELTRLWRFNRPALARRIVERAAAHDRVALFGPRQTGKTSLLLQEVVPLAAELGLLPVYIECWADRGDPTGSIVHALTKAIDDLRIPAAGLQRSLKSRVNRLGVAGASLELAAPRERQLPASKYLQIDAALSALLRETKKDLLLVFDEFQAIAEGPAAENATAAVRAALTSAERRVGAVFSGSSELLLLELFARARAALYGFAHPEPYPLLGADFVAHVARKFKAATQRELATAEAMAVLQTLGHQPEPFLNAVVNAMAQPRWGIADGLKAMLDPGMRNKWTINWTGLTDMQRAALLLVFRSLPPTSKEALSEAGRLTGQPRVAGSTITRALEALQIRGLVQKDLVAGRRSWVIGDPVMAAWLAQNGAGLLG